VVVEVPELMELQVVAVVERLAKVLLVLDLLTPAVEAEVAKELEPVREVLV
jgi:hypothetical protein